MNKLLKNMKKVVSIMLVMSMVFTSHAFVTFAEGLDNAETTTQETTVYVDNEIVGANSPEAHSREVSPEEDTEETTETTETTVAEEVAGSQAHPYNSNEETTVAADSETVGADIIRLEDEAEELTETTDYVEEPEEDVKETETTIDETEATKAIEETTTFEEEAGEEETTAAEETTATEEGEVETSEDKKIDDNIYGVDDRMLDRISEVVPPPVKNYYVGDKYDLTGYEITAWYDDDSFENIVYADNKSRFTFEPDYVNNPFTASTPEGEPIDLTITYTDTENRSASYTKAIQVHAAPTTTYTVQYNQNLPSGYTISTSKTWYTDSTTTDLTGSPIVLEGSDDMTCEDTSGNTRTLQGWNTYSSGAGSSYSFGASINTDAGFIGDTLTLYAMWSDPVAPTTGFMYWKVDGDDNNKTIHYYASPGEGRAAVVIGTNGVEHTSLGSSDREKIKYAVFEDNIDATNLKCCFENFKGLESITNIGKLDTSNVTSMRQMFNFAGVKELDLTNFDTSNVTDMYGMFSSCENLETIRVSDKFVVDKVSTSNGKFMFSNCDKLVGEKGTKIADLSSPFGVAYAHIDEGSSNPGLFSSASTPTTTYTVKYNQDLPTGYTLSGGMTWYTDSTTTDLTGNPIILKGSVDMTCEDASGNTRTLQSWNTQIEHKGNTFNFGAEFKDSQYFDPDPTCTLYAMWSDPVGPTPTTYTIKYDKNLPSGYTISTSKTWYTDSTSDDLSSNPIKISGSAGMTCENADGYVRKLEAWNTLADKSGTPYMFAENISSPAAFTSNPLTLYAVWGDPVVPTPGTDKFYIISYGNPTEYLNEKKIFAFDSTYTVEEMENFVANNLSKCINPSGKAANGFYDMSELIPVGADDTQVRQILNDNYDLTKEKIRTLDKIAVWFEDYIPDPMGVYLGITFEGSTPAKTVTKIAIKTNPTKTTYDSGDAFDPTGLIIKVTYSDSSTEDIDYATHASDFSFNPTTITKSGNVVVTYSGKTANVTVKVNGGPTPPGPTPPSPGGGGTGGGTSGGGSSDPAHGPMGDLTKELQQQQQKATDKKQARKVENDELATLLKSYNENHNAPMVNARDDNGNVGFGQWFRIPGSTIWYFLTSDFNQNVTTVNSNAGPNPTQTANQNKTEGFLVDGWFNLGWDGVDRWYRFDENGIMLMGWWIEDGKTYFLQTDENDNWYGKAMTGTQVIDGITYNFNENGVLIQ